VILGGIARLDGGQRGQAVTPTLRLRLMGHMGIDDSLGRVSLPRTRKARAILAILAMASPRPVLRLNLIALLWSQRQNDQARASLRQAVHELQDVLGPTWGRLLHAERHHLSLHGGGLSVDALNLHSASPRDADAVRQFQNPLLEDLAGLDPAFDRWLTEERGRMNRAALVWGESILAGQRDPAALLELAEQLLTMDRGHEGVWRAVIRCHAGAGDRHAARLAYERCRAARAELGYPGVSLETEELLVRIGGTEAPPIAVDAPALSARGEPWGPPNRSAIRLGILPLRLVDSNHPAHGDGLVLGLTEELTTCLTRFSWISCVSGSSLTAIWGEAATGTRPWHGIDADFMLDGTIQRGGDKVRILMRIIAMRSGGEVVWARRFERNGTDILALQDELSAEIVAQVEPELLMRAGERGRGRAAPLLAPHELVLRAIPALYRMERDGFQTAGQMLEQAVAADANQASAHAWYAYWHLFLLGQGWAVDQEAAARRAGELAERAVTLDPGDARALTMAGHVRGFASKRPREALALHERAIALNPNLALAWGCAGMAFSYLGQHDDALIRLRQAIRMSPSDPHSFFFDTSITIPYLLLGDHEKAVEFGRRAVELNPGFSSAYKMYLSALGHLGRTQEANKVRSRLLTLETTFTIANAVERSPFTVPKDLAHYAEGLRRAGLS
jgi:DNA-binding SARP family transcriptional activator/TolB-like protein/Flp pilus assembly protein TadD